MSSPIQSDEACPLGFSAEDLVDTLGKTREVTLQWADGSQVGATLSFDEMNALEFVDFDEYGMCVDSSFDYCDSLRFSTLLSFVTEDGIFDESIGVSDIAVSASSMRLHSAEPFNLHSVHGSYQVPDEYEGTEFESVEAKLEVLWTGSEVSGEILGLANYKPESGGETKTGEGWKIAGW